MQILITKEKQQGVFRREKSNFGDKKWSKKEIANKHINKTASVSRRTRTNGIREQKTKRKFSQNADVAICYIASHTHWGNVCLCYEVNV